MSSISTLIEASSSAAVLLGFFMVRLAPRATSLAVSVQPPARRPARTFIIDVYSGGSLKSAAVVIANLGKSRASVATLAALKALRRDIVAAQACGANALTHVADASILKRVLSDSVSTRLFVTAWNGANVTISIVFGFY